MNLTINWDYLQFVCASWSKIRPIVTWLFLHWVRHIKQAYIGQLQPSHCSDFFQESLHTRQNTWRHLKSEKEGILQNVLTVGSPVCSKVSFLWSNSWWWEAVDTQCTANTLHAMRNRWLSSRSGRKWDAGILHTRMDDDIQSLKWNLNCTGPSENRNKGLQNHSQQKSPPKTHRPTLASSMANDRNSII